MKILVNRAPSDHGCTIGDMFIDGVWEAFTCEDQLREVPGQPVETWKVPNETAIPAGTYPVIIDDSERFKRPMPHILDVPGFTGIRIHTGNSAASTAGCLLLGQTKTSMGVFRSVLAFDAFLPKLQAALDAGEAVTITIRNP